MTQETAKERTYREALEILRGMGINSKNRVMMPYGVAVTAQEFIEEKLEDAENMPSTTDKLSVEKLQEQLNTAKYFFKNILDVDPNLNKGHVSHLKNCVRVMKHSAEKALAVIEKGEHNEI
ncbi:hypothetical protein [Lactococcus lactis]|uniref:hypothetical protein n=1 Tax=Lactococcus lactis TaxID=1358 RepID=UPI0018A97CE6|nr:hypothetical protein [Lactococcus lactis]